MFCINMDTIEKASKERCKDVHIPFSLGGTPNSETYYRQRFYLCGSGVLLHIFQNKSMY